MVFEKSLNLEIVSFVADCANQLQENYHIIFKALVSPFPSHFSHHPTEIIGRAAFKAKKKITESSRKSNVLNWIRNAENLLNRKGLYYIQHHQKT